MTRPHARPELENKVDLHHVASPWGRRRIRFLWLLFAVAVFALGTWGFLIHGDRAGKELYVSGALYRSLQLFVMQSGDVEPPVPWPLEIARWLAPAVTILSGVSLVFREQLRQWLLGWRLRNHVVICGLGRKTLLFTRDYHSQGRKVLVIEKSDANPLVHTCRALGIPVVIGSATRPEVLRRAQLQRARTLICLTDEDLTNAEIAARARELVKGRSARGRPLHCFVHFEDLIVCRNLRDCELSRAHDHFRVDYFNVHEMGARAMLDKYGLPPGPAGGGGQSPPAPPVPPHLLVIGLGRQGETLLLEATRRWRRGAAWKERGEKLTITVVERDARTRLDSLTARFWQLEETCRLVAEDPQDDRTRFDTCGFAFDDAGKSPATIAYVCPHDEQLGLETALRLYRQCRENHHEMPIVLRLHGSRAIEKLLPGKDSGEEYAHLHVFSLYHETCHAELLVGVNEQLAQAIHEQYQAQAQHLQAKRGTTRPRSWHELSEKEKEQHRRKVDRLGTVLHLPDGRRYRIVRLHRLAPDYPFREGDVERVAENEHRRWCEENKGGRHPELVPWEQLPAEVRQRKIQEAHALPEILALVDFEIQPPE